MSDFVDMMVEMLPMHSNLQSKSNSVRKVLDNTVGVYMDNFELPYEQIFLTSATGGWLDAWGRDYGVSRRINEDDETYRRRIVYEKLDNLTAKLLMEVYNVDLYAFVDDFDASENTLTSDNPYLNREGYLGSVDSDTQQILDKKFILDTGVVWL